MKMKKGDKFKSKDNGTIIVLIQKTGDRWRCRKINNGKGINNGHVIHANTIKRFYEEVK